MNALNGLLSHVQILMFSRGIFDHVATPQRRPNPQPRLPKTPTNTNTNNSTDTSDPESAKKKRYRPRKKKTDDVSDESLTEEVSNMLLKASVDSFLNNNGNSNNNTNNNNVPRVVRVRNNSTGKVKSIPFSLSYIH